MTWAIDLLNTIDAKTIVIPFTGSAKDIASFANPDRSIYSWDTQEMSNVLVGVLSQPFATKLDKAYGIEGYAKDEFPFQDMDVGTAKLLNYIAQRGTVHEKAALVKVLFRSTVMGRLTQWRAALNGYEETWAMFLRARESLEVWSNKPGKLVHTKGSFFDSKPPASCDLIYIDPPKVLDRTDIYSGKPYTHLNSILEQKQVVLPRWTGDIYLDRMKQVLASTNWKVAVLFHASGLVPTLEGLIAGLPYKLSHMMEFAHETRADYALVYKREEQQTGT